MDGRMEVRMEFRMLVCLGYQDGRMDVCQYVLKDIRVGWVNVRMDGWMFVGTGELVDGQMD